MSSRVEVPTLKPTELFEKRRERDGAKLKSYNKILEQIYSRIRASSREGADPWIIYTIPPFIIGLPKLDLEDCVVYIVYILRNQGYEVRYTYPNLLYISWKHHEKDYILKNSPIMTAMLQSQNTKPKQELRGQSTARVRFADQVQKPVQQNQGYKQQDPQQYQGPPTIGRAPPKSVTEYQPPSSFLDALEKAPVSEPRKDALNDFLNF
jgi:hypothetical protein